MSIIKGAAFDAAHVRGKSDDYQKDLDFNNLEASRHEKHLEEDYNFFREKGFSFFRDGSLLYKTMPNSNEFNWNYLDRVARQAEKSDVQISLSHYEFPCWLSSDDILNRKMLEPMVKFTIEFSNRYKNIFHSVIPFVEIGWWCAMMGEFKKMHPFANGWWSIYKIILEANIECAKILRENNIAVAMSEPAGTPLSFNDQMRPFKNLMGVYDEVAEREGCVEFRKGSKDLLQYIGLNCYYPDSIEYIYNKTKEEFPDKYIYIAETGNAWHQHISPDDWFDKMKNLNTTCVWSPAIEYKGMHNGEYGVGFLLSKERSEYKTVSV